MLQVLWTTFSVTLHQKGHISVCKQEQSLFPSTPARTSFEQIVQTWNLASCPVKYKLARAIGTCHLPTKIQSRVLAAADF